MAATPDAGGAHRTFDYIIVGSGAGGAPLAARLAQRGYQVLVLEAGPEQTATDTPAREVGLVPGFHALSSEHPDVSWEFFVKHYDTPPSPDPKWHSDPKNPARDGIFYPRASGVGGCTIHNAMITIAGPDSDWENLADFVNDDSWRGAAMRAYFQRLEHNEYSKPPTAPPTSWFGRARDLLKWVIGRDADYTRGRHGFDGWLHTSLTDIKLGLGDKQLLKMLSAALWHAVFAGLDRAWTLAAGFLEGRTTQQLDPNHARTQAEHPEGVITVPLAVCGKATTIHQRSDMPFVMRGRRSSPRELLLGTRVTRPDQLEIWTNALVTNVVFAPGDPPRAIGVRFLKGERLYRAHQQPSDRPGTPGEVFVKDGGEVILCGGAFNTPQLLMLSGLGKQSDLEAMAKGSSDVCVLKGRDDRPLSSGGQPARVDLPGVGRNLQDRYEVTLLSEMRQDFSILQGASFLLPGNGVPADPILEEWRAEGTGLYTSNGSVLGILKRSRPDLAQPDLFMFGLPLPFKGYEVGYSTMHQHNRFTWAILKGHTRNGDGTVMLRSTDPRDPPLVNFHYFNEVTCPGKGNEDPDLAAVVEGVKFVRGIAKKAESWLLGRRVIGEAHPGTALVPEGDDQRIRDWVRSQAWGHHACGTCRMGPANDPYAVLDSRFRVRGVAGLRVVDASIFPRIPGYFIVTNIYMASEKAADVIIEDATYGLPDTPIYPRDLRAREACALEERRKKVILDPSNPMPMPAPESAPLTWSPDVAALGLSGGGIRSATFNLGILQALARERWLRRLDFLSTVSGGGYIGSFLGRAFDRLRSDSLWGGEREPVQSAPDRVERELDDPDSPALRWLRKQANYLVPSGEGDVRVNTATFLRNFLSVHFVVGSLLLALFGTVNALRYGIIGPISTTASLLALDQTQLPLGALLKGFLGPFFSPWLVIFELILLFMVLPRIIGYWIVSQDKHGRYAGPGLALLFVLVSALLFAAIYNGLKLPVLAIAVAPLFAFIHVELAWRRGKEREEAIGRGSVETQRLRTRNYLTYDLGVALTLAAGALVFGVVDTLAHGLHQWLVVDSRVYAMAFASFIAAVAALAPIARFLAGLFTREKKSGPPSTLDRLLRQQLTAGLLAAVLLIVPLVFASFAAHAAYGGGQLFLAGLAATALAWIISIVLAFPGALVFVNRSSLSQTYAARLARAYLGASNPLRYRPEGRDVTEVMADDDVPSIQDYRPHVAGGPLHLLNVTINQTVDFSSQRGNRDRKGENLAVSSIGLSIGGIWHAAWTDRPQDPATQIPRKRPSGILPLGHVPGTEHPLIDETGRPTRSAEMLSLRQWMAISGAAFGPGQGQSTKLGTALLFGLANLRTGYWWNSGITESARDGFPPLTVLLRLVYFFESWFLTQTLLLFEWVARFAGPWERFWYLSDGGFFENLAAYELIRRRVPRIILCDATEDATYEFGSFANLVRKARIDFNAEIVPFTDDDYERNADVIPEPVRAVLGPLSELAPPKEADGSITGPSKKHASLFWVRYRPPSTEPAVSPSQETTRAVSPVLLYIKAGLTGDEGIDIEQYHGEHQEFPHEGTVDQFFDEAQWESYRSLGDHIASKLVAGHGPWLWSVHP